jgi:small-conductance mechanosensitive channel
LISNPVKTFTSEELIRLETLISVHYAEDLEKVFQVIKQTVNSFEHVINKDKTAIVIDSFAARGIDLKIWYYYNPK